MANWWNALFMRTFRTSLRTCKFLHGLIAHRITIIETKFRMRGLRKGWKKKSSDFRGAENTSDPIEQFEKDLSACISAGTTRKRAEVANDALNARVSSDEASGSLEKATAEQTMSKAEQEAWLKHLLTHHPK